MAIIESLPCLEVIYLGLIQDNDTMLDNLFAAHGKTLKKLHFSMKGDKIPRALLEQNNVLINLEIDYSSEPFLSADSIIKICNTKQKGFSFKISSYGS